MKSKALELKVQTRQDVLYQGEIDSLTSVNKKGKFDVLRKHANFISLIKDFVLIRDLKGKEYRLNIGQGLMKVLGNQINIYLGIKQD